MALNTSIRGSQIKDAFFGAGLKRNGVNANIAEVSVDNSSIEINVDDLRVKALGITNGMLAGSITDDKLVENYIKVGDVDGVTLEFASGDILQVKDGGISEAKLNMYNSPATGKVLGYTANGMEWVDQTVTDAIVESDIVKENESANCNGTQVNFTLANTPVADSIQVFLNGLLQEEGAGKDYTVSGTTVTFAVAPDTGDILVIYYVKNN